MTTSNAASKQHLRFLDGLRALAALLVILHHAWLQSWPYTMYPTLRPTGITGALTGWLAFGKIAVTAFIVISGFCLMLPVVKYGKEMNAGPFFLRRCRRILPPYYVALLLALLLDLFVLKPHTGTIYDGSFPLTPSGLIAHLFLVQNFTSNPFQITGPFWSIAVEFQIYLFFPFFIWVYRKWGIAYTVALTTVMGYSLSALFTKYGLNETYSHYVAMFGFGMFAAHFAFTVQGDRLRKAKLVAYALLPVLILTGGAAHRRFGSNKLITDALLGLLMSCVLFLATISPEGRLSKILSFEPLVWAGAFSYSIYLLHFPLQQMLWQWIVQPAGLSRAYSFLLVSSLGTAIIIGLSRVFFELFEKPFMTKSADGQRRAALASNDV